MRQYDRVAEPGEAVMATIGRHDLYFTSAFQTSVKALARDAYRQPRPQ